MLRKVTELPASKAAGRANFVARDVREFCRNHTYDVAEVTVEGHGAKSVVDSCKHYIRRHPEQCGGVWAALRSGHAYLYRKVVTDR